MATYREIQERAKGTDGFVPKTCWIAHVKADHGLTVSSAPNRISSTLQAHPCPPSKRPAIEAALEHLGMA